MGPPIRNTHVYTRYSEANLELLYTPCLCLRTAIRPFANMPTYTTVLADSPSPLCEHAYVYHLTCGRPCTPLQTCLRIPRFFLMAMHPFANMYTYTYHLPITGYFGFTPLQTFLRTRTRTTDQYHIVLTSPLCKYAYYVYHRPTDNRLF